MVGCSHATTRRGTSVSNHDNNSHPLMWTYSRRLHQIEVEAKRTLSLNILSRNEKEAILREKYNATMKPLLWVLEHMDYVTSQQPETHNERIFQNTFGETISQALEQLRHPDNYTNPQQAWEPFKEVFIISDHVINRVIN